MAKKKLKSGFELPGIAPNILLKDVENTAPFLFQGELLTNLDNHAYLLRLIDAKRNLKSLNHLNLSEYFYLCLAAHWATAGTFVPTDVDKQIRQGLWKHNSIHKHIIKMAELTIESLTWDYSQVSRRVCLNAEGKILVSTHEGTWFSVAIGAYCALIVNGHNDKAKEVSQSILEEIEKEENLLLKLISKKDHLSFIKACPLIAHNFGDLDRVMVAWDMHDKDPFCKSIYKLGHVLNEKYSKLLVYQGEVNKEFTANENHRHMSLRVPKCLRRSSEFLIHVGPFLDEWGKIIALSKKLSIAEKAEIIIALFDGFNREKESLAYARAYAGILKNTPSGLNLFEEFISYDVMNNLKSSKFTQISEISQQNFEQSYIERLDNFTCPKTGINFASF